MKPCPKLKVCNFQPQAEFSQQISLLRKLGSLQIQSFEGSIWIRNWSFLINMMEKVDFTSLFLWKAVEEVWGFHGTSREGIQGISKTGFLHPGSFSLLISLISKMTLQNSKPKINQKQKARKRFDGNEKNSHKKDHHMPKPPDVLDDGYYGKGIYFTMYSDYA